jgi:CRP-like cAMP-binding protein
MTQRPAIQRALWLSTLIDGSIFSEWITNVGRRDARTRVSHLLCELAVRMKAIGRLDKGTYQLPMTQEEIGDATGLTSVHVNRTMQDLRRSGLITSDRRSITIDNWQALATAGGFDAGYLHQEGAAAALCRAVAGARRLTR